MTRALPVVIAVVVVAGVVVFGQGGCHVPISPSAPLDVPTAETLDATTFGLQVEYPAVDMLATVASEPDPSRPDRYPGSDSPSYRAHVATGIGPSTGLQFGVEGTVYGLIPVPQGGWLGLRQLLSSSDARDIGLAVRAGYAGFLATYDELPYDGSTVSVAYMAFTGGVRFKRWDAVQPGLAVTAQPVVALPSIEGLAPGEQVDTLYGVLAAGTVSVTIKGVTPFVTGGAVYSSNARGLGPYLSFGLALLQR